MDTGFVVTIPNYQWRVKTSNAARPKYWKWSEKEKLPKKHKENLYGKAIKVGQTLFCCDKDGNRFLKNTKSVGEPKYWVMNGQSLYNAALLPIMRSKVAHYYHDYFTTYINEQLPVINLEGRKLSIGFDLFMVRRSRMPDISNMWPVEKFFEDALVRAGKIPDDDPNYVIESGRKKYHWVDTEDECRLEVTLKFVYENDN